MYNVGGNKIGTGLIGGGCEKYCWLAGGSSDFKNRNWVWNWTSFGDSSVSENPGGISESEDCDDLHDEDAIMCLICFFLYKFDLSKQRSVVQWNVTIEWICKSQHNVWSRVRTLCINVYRNCQRFSESNILKPHGFMPNSTNWAKKQIHAQNSMPHVYAYRCPAILNILRRVTVFARSKWVVLWVVCKAHSMWQ